MNMHDTLRATTGRIGRSVTFKLLTICILILLLLIPVSMVQSLIREREWRQERVVGEINGILTVLYGYLYILLQLTDYALLMGSVGLFVLLALVMFLTRRVDWYAVRSDEENLTMKMASNHGVER
ncbi:hypothetical protein DSCO28_51660 [Desulfosarcina ovata subsp. sediminis]|uniref:Uncharacterized protein n=1 Tax=Desulfosarcina ovata subsp. sediminis TaxID=885957 RepID=A0A5K7ZWW7_9BACT|nr:inner membrane CreD family protein [Desulfosarcina ovata]BBO84600.1 hypothetical protein DSCO28_51660 [Desulfosarcina ovata subsp. sediminis]